MRRNVEALQGEAAKFAGQYGLLDHLHPWAAGRGRSRAGQGAPLEAVFVQQIQGRSVVKKLSTAICRHRVGIALCRKGLPSPGGDTGSPGNEEGASRRLGFSLSGRLSGRERELHAAATARLHLTLYPNDRTGSVSSPFRVGIKSD